MENVLAWKAVVGKNVKTPESSSISLQLGLPLQVSSNEFDGALISWILSPSIITELGSEIDALTSMSS